MAGFREGDKPDLSKELWSVKETAAFLEMTPSAVRMILNLDKLTHHRVGASGGRIRIRPADVMAYLETCRKGAKSAPATAVVTRAPLVEGIDHYAALGRKRG